eukprot:TRINITY_DN36966_c0_g1_i2.p1 TRINITY_DN36966_c0_g1~~TRINITY_DN36966_c0_g1_i2.p1  ORF type:complete len:494 (-),score=68.85 TRINITY_DN36966_c0_g1_i2:26-1480(-)
MDPRARAGYSLIPTSDGHAGSVGSAAGQSSPSHDQGGKLPAVDTDAYAETKTARPWLAGRALRFVKHTSTGMSKIAPNSVYGAALALPQLARSAGWTISYTGLAARGIIFMIVNNLLQGFLLYMICKEERIINKFGTQMFLCDFGAQLTECPDGNNCVGPGGTTFTPARLFDFELWSTRTYVRDALKTLFPERIDEIQQKVDPGEYGVESYHLRGVCCFLFVLGLWEDLAGSWDMLDLIMTVPTRSETWVEPVDGAAVDSIHSQGKEGDKTYLLAADFEKHASFEIDFCEFKVAGMPIHWKVFNILCVVLPKFYLWLLTVDVGIVFLMETSVIEEMIINCVALGFILNIDELMMSIMPPESSALLDKINGYPKGGQRIHLTEEEEITRHALERAWSIFSPALYQALIPRRLMAMLITTAFFVCKYYLEHCERESDGSWVSKSLHLPEKDGLSFLTFLFGPFPMLFPIRAQTEPVWEMPRQSPEP